MRFNDLKNKKLIYEYSLLVHMTSINISIKKEAYEFLNQFKKNNMSYSDVILSFKKNENSMNKFFGKLSHVDRDAKKNSDSSFRKSFEDRLK